MLSSPHVLRCADPHVEVCRHLPTIEEEKAFMTQALYCLTLPEDLQQERLDYLWQVILQHLMVAFTRYQRKNLRILYDALGTLADAVGSALNQPRYVQVHPIVIASRGLTDATPTSLILVPSRWDNDRRCEAHTLGWRLLCYPSGASPSPAGEVGAAGRP